MRVARIFVLGVPHSRKTSFIHYLMNEEDLEETDDVTKNEPIKSYKWFPFKNKYNRQLLEENEPSDYDSEVMIWEMSGNQVHQKIHSFFFTPGALYIIVAQHDIMNSSPIIQLINNIQSKVPKCHIQIVLVNRDKSSMDQPSQNPSRKAFQELINATMDNEKNRFDTLREEMEQIRLFASDLKTDDRKKQIENLLKNRTTLYQQIYLLNIHSKKNSTLMMTSLLQNCKEQFSANEILEKSEIQTVWHEVSKLNKTGAILTTRNDLFSRTKQEMESFEFESFKDSLKALENSGFLLDLESCGLCNYEEGESIICLDSLNFARILHRCHIGKESKTFRLQPHRFWPDGTGKPDPQVLVDVLKIVQTHGIIPESLLPLLWVGEQDRCELDEGQIKMILKSLIGLGVLLPLDPKSNQSSQLQAPRLETYPFLSPSRCYYAVFMDCLNDLRPTLNWTSKPFPGDIQVICWFRFQLTSPQKNLLQQILGVCYQSIYSVSSYQHLWKYGILLRVREVMLCAEYTPYPGNRLCIMGRIDLHSQTNERNAVRLIWSVMARPILATLAVLKSFPGVIYSCFLEPSANHFFAHTENRDCPKRVFAVEYCLSRWQDKLRKKNQEEELTLTLKTESLFPFQVDNFRGSLKDLLELILDQEHDIITETHPTPDEKPEVDLYKMNGATFLGKPCSLQQQQGIITNNNKQEPIRKQLGVQVKWKPLVNKLESAAAAAQPETHQRREEDDDDYDNGDHYHDNDDDDDNDNIANFNSEDPEKDASVGRKAKSTHDSNDEKEDANMGAPVRVFVSEAEEIEEITRVASSFVASVMALAVAKYISSISDTCPVLGTVAEVSAKAAVATNDGDINAAVAAILSVVQAVKQQINSNEINKPTPKTPNNSRFCTLL